MLAHMTVSALENKSQSSNGSVKKLFVKLKEAKLNQPARLPLQYNCNEMVTESLNF